MLLYNIIMKNIRDLTFYKKSYFLLALILLVFLLKGAVFATLLPFLQGFDEDKHFATVQYYAEPKEKTWEITRTGKKAGGTNFNDLNTYNLSEEEIQTSKVINFGSLRINSLNTPPYLDGQFGEDEQKIIGMPWQKYIDKYPPAITGHQPLYYLLTSPIIKMLWDKDIFTRFFAVRLFSILFGILTILLAFLIAKKIGFPEKISLLITAIVAFQPLFSQTSSTINTDNLLTLAFTLFIFGGVSILKDGINWKNSTIALIAVLAGVFIKAPGVVMVPVAYFLFLYAFYKKLQIKKSRFILGAIIISLLLVFLAYLISPYSLQTLLAYGKASHFSSTSESITSYFATSFKKFTSFELSYWGIFGLLNAPISHYLLYVIWPIELIALAGILIYLLKKNPASFFNPDKKIILFLLAITLALQFGVRFADWRIFDGRGSLILNIYGRYFVPTIVSHFLLIAIGYLVIFRKEKNYENFFKLMLILMVLLLAYSIFNVIIPRYYL